MATNKDGIEFDVDALVTDVNGKADKDLVNCTVPYVVSRTPNSQGGVVEIWSDGYCVQTGIGNFVGGNRLSEGVDINLSQAYKDAAYTLIATMGQGAYFATSEFVATKLNASLIHLQYYDSSGNTINRDPFSYNWRTEGYIR